jgi:hypothetical protein
MDHRDVGDDGQRQWERRIHGGREHGPRARSGTLTIAGQPFTVSQAAGTCVYAITPTSASLGSGAGAGPTVAVTTTAGCAWTATSQASWIAVTPGQSGTGTGSVTFRVTANSGNRRTGTMTIAGRTFTVTQDKRDH